MSEQKLLGNFIENTNAMLTFHGGAPNWTQDISLSSSFTGNVYIVDKTDSLKTSVAEIMAMVRARDARALIPLPASPETGDK